MVQPCIDVIEAIKRGPPFSARARRAIRRVPVDWQEILAGSLARINAGFDTANLKDAQAVLKQMP